MLDLRRRQFITLLGGATVWPVAVRAQQTGKLRTIGFLGESTSLDQSERTTAFVQRLRELGWIEGRTVAIEYRWAEGRSERFAEIATEFVRLKVDIHRHVINPSSYRVQAGDHSHSDRIRNSSGPYRHWSRREPGATGRQRHWLIDPVDGYCRKATCTLARDCPRSPPFGDHDQPR